MTQSVTVIEDPAEVIEAVISKTHEKWEKGMSYKKFLMALDAKERNVVVIGNFIGQVRNGGLSQWIWNDYHEGMQFLEFALEDLGTETAKEVLKIAAWSCDNAEQIKEEEEDEDECTEIETQFDKYDNRFYEIDDQLVEDLARKIRNDLMEGVIKS